MKARTKATLLWFFGMATCIVPAVLATLEHFPIWVAEGGETIISGLSVILLVVCALPFKKQIASYLQSPSAWVVWLCIFVFSSLLGKIICDIASISFVAFVSNFLGALIFKWREKYTKAEQK